MSFCDYCACLDCRTGKVHLCDDKGDPRPSDLTLSHAPTEFGDWICSICYDYEECIDWQKVLGEPVDPCTDRDCGHRPRLLGRFRKASSDEGFRDHMIEHKVGAISRRRRPGSRDP